MNVLDFDGQCRVDSDAELRSRLRAVRRGNDGAFILDHGGPESLSVHFNGTAAFLWFCPDQEGGHPGFVPQGMWAGERSRVRFLQTNGFPADAIEVPWWQLMSVEVAYRAAVEYLRSPSRPASVSWFEL